MIHAIRVVFLVLVSAFLLISAAGAQEYEYKEYTVKKGDTLWDISGSELEDYFNWPMIWKENLRINNPDLIYPGQVIVIPVRVKMPGERELAIPMEAPPAPVAEKPEAAPAEEAAAEGLIEPGKAHYLIAPDLVLESGYITKTPPYVGEVTGDPVGKEIFGQFDELYIKTAKPAEVGDKFYVIRKQGKVKHPGTSEYLGQMVRVLGVVETIEAGTSGLRARVLKTFDGIKKGDALDEYYELEAPIGAGEPRKPRMDAMVVALSMLKQIGGGFETIFIDKGERDGLLEGDVLMTLWTGTDDKKNAIIQIVNMRQSTSLALVLDSETAIREGDTVVGAE